MPRSKATLTREQLEAHLALQRIEELKRREGFWFFNPQDYQLPFDTSLAKRIVDFGGNRSGKTMHFVYRLIRIAAGRDPYNEFYGWEPPIYLRACGAGMHEQVLKVLVEWFRKLMPREWCEGGDFSFNTQSGLLRTAERSPCKGGWFEFMSYDQDPEKGSGRPLHGVAFDEAYKCSERFRNQCLARLVDYGGFAWAIETPEDGDATWSVKWADRSAMRTSYNKQTHKIELHQDDTKDPEYAAFCYPTVLNKYLYPDEDRRKRSDAIEQLIKDCEGDETQIRIRLYGDFISIGGIVYPMLSNDLHMKLGHEVGVDGTWINSLNVDPKVGVNKEHCCTWAAEGPGDSIHFYRELYCTGTMEEMMHAVRSKSAPGERIAVINFDPHWDWDNQLVAKPGKEEPFNLYESLVEAKNAAGYHDVPVVEARRDKHVWFGIDQVISLLRPQRTGTHPQLTFSPECARLFDEMRRYSCVRQKEKDPTRYRPRVRKIDDDGPDTVRICVTSPRVYHVGYGAPEIIRNESHDEYDIPFWG